MKTIIVLLLVVPIITVGQTNTFPTTGNVEIGTTVPLYGKLHINDTGADQGLNLWTDSRKRTSRFIMVPSVPATQLSLGPGYNKPLLKTDKLFNNEKILFSILIIEHSIIFCPTILEYESKST